MPPTPFSRRDFGLALATGASSVAFTHGSATPADEQPKPQQKPAPEKANEPQEVPEPVYLLGAVLKHYSDQRLDDAAIGGILRDINGDLVRGRVLSNFPLKNSDEPGVVFQAWRGD